MDIHVCLNCNQNSCLVFLASLTLASQISAPEQLLSSNTFQVGMVFIRVGMIIDSQNSKLLTTQLGLRAGVPLAKMGGGAGPNGAPGRSGGGTVRQNKGRP